MNEDDGFDYFYQEEDELMLSAHENALDDYEATELDDMWRQMREQQERIDERVAAHERIAARQSRAA